MILGSGPDSSPNNQAAEHKIPQPAAKNAAASLGRERLCRSPTPGCPGPTVKRYAQCSAAVLAMRAPHTAKPLRPKGAPTLRRSPACSPARRPARRGFRPSRPSSRGAGAALRTSSAPARSRTRASPIGPLRSGTAATRAAPKPEHPPQRYALRAHTRLAQALPPPRALSSAAIAAAHGSAAAPRSLHARSRPSRACMALRAISQNHDGLPLAIEEARRKCSSFRPRGRVAAPRNPLEIGPNRAPTSRLSRSLEGTD